MSRYTLLVSGLRHLKELYGGLQRTFCMFALLFMYLSTSYIFGAYVYDVLDRFLNWGQSITCVSGHFVWNASVCWPLSQV